MEADYRRLVEQVGMERFERLCALLGAAERHGSLRRATEELDLSYRYAWGLIRRAEATLEQPLLRSRVGGAAGGGAELTETARDMLRRSRLVQSEVEPRLASILGPVASREQISEGPLPLLMASTIGPSETGLVDGLAAAYHARTGVWVRNVSAGTGQALAIARAGRVDLLLVHAPLWEERFVADGLGLGRWPLMRDAFELCGPEADPAGVTSAASAVEAMRRIARARAPFLSRGDNSGTHARELALWAAAGVAPGAGWYVAFSEGGRGSAATLREAEAAGAYTLVDSATVATIRPSRLRPLFSGDPDLANQFSLVPLNPARFAGVQGEAARQFVAWAVGLEGQAFVRAFGADRFGSALYQPAAKEM